jgi:integrase
MPRKGSLRIRLWHARLRGGRLDISADTTDPKVQGIRQAAIEALAERGDWDTIEHVRSRLIDITDVQRAARTEAWDGLRPRVERPKAVPMDLTVGGMLEATLRRTRGIRAENTYDQYVSYAKVLREYFGEGRDATTVTTDEAEAFLHRVQPTTGKVWSPGTQHLYAMFAGQVWRRAIDADAERAEIEDRKPRIRNNPWRKADRPEKRTTRHAFLAPDQWVRFAEYVGRTAPSKLGLYATACLAGLRQQEVAHLRPGLDVDLKARLIRVQPRGGEMNWQTKTTRSVRDVPMCDQLHEILLRHSKGYAGERYFFHPEWTDAPPSGTAIAAWTKRDMEAVGLRYGRDEGDTLTFHSFRHTFASWLAQADKSLLLIADLLGDTVDVVTRYYAHLMPSNRRAGVAVIDQAIATVSATFSSDPL